MRCFVMFVTAVCVLFLLNLYFSKTANFQHSRVISAEKMSVEDWNYVCNFFNWFLVHIQSKACASLCFSASPPRIGYLSLWMHQGLSPPWFITPRGISATRNMKSRLAIKFPTPWVVIECPAPGKTKFIKFPPSRTRKDVKCPGCVRRGGGGCFSFDLTDT